MKKRPQKLRLLVVDDERSIRDYLKTSLSAYGYHIFEATSGKEALTRTVSTHPDVIILDLGLPDMDGIDVLIKLRKRCKTPVIILSVRDDAADKITALDAGADDYLVKPFQTGELLARLRAVMRRLLPISEENIQKFGKLSMNITLRQVTFNKKRISLSPIEYDLLKLFVMNAGKVITHQQILQQIWDKTEEYEGILHLLRVTISNLRNKLEPDPDRPQYILTEPGIGYRLAAHS